MFVGGWVSECVRMDVCICAILTIYIYLLSKTLIALLWFNNISGWKITSIYASNKLQFDLKDSKKIEKKTERRETKRDKNNRFYVAWIHWIGFVCVDISKWNGMKWNEVSCWMHVVVTQLIAVKSIFQYVCMYTEIRADSVTHIPIEKEHFKNSRYTTFFYKKIYRLDLTQLKSVWEYVCSWNQFESLSFLSSKYIYMDTVKYCE